MKILLTGRKGTLSSSIKEKYNCLEIKNDSREVIHRVIKENVHSAEKVFILHFAAETNVDLCEKNKLLAINSNYVFTKNIVDEIKNFSNVALVFISSASIFNGKVRKKYSKDDPPEPANFYAFTKFLSEQYITQNLDKYYIFRFGWLIGDPQIDNKFIGNVFRQLLSKEKKMFGVNDVFGSLTFADEFTMDLDVIFKNDLEYGTYNYCTESELSRFDIIKYIVEYYDLNNSIEVLPKKLSDFQLTANRPKYEILSTENSRNKLITELNWKTALNKFLNKYSYLLR